MTLLRRAIRRVLGLPRWTRREEDDAAIRLVSLRRRFEQSPGSLSNAELDELE